MRIITPSGSGKYNLIHRPKSQFNNFDVHARAYVALCDTGFDVRGEYFLKKGDAGSGSPQMCLDLVVFHKRKALSIVVVKSESAWAEDTRQKSRYTQFGVPVLVISNEEDIAEMVTACCIYRGRQMPEDYGTGPAGIY